MPTIDSTVGGASANSYISLAEANAYTTTRLFNDAWAAADDPTKESAIIWACRLLDASFDWNGKSTTDTQALAWPRISLLNRNGFAIPDNVLPQPLKDAQAEWARTLVVADRTADNEVTHNRLTSLTAGPVTLQFESIEQAGADVQTKNAEIRRQSPDFLYLDKSVPDAVRQILVKTWWKVAQVSEPLIFMASGGGHRHHHGNW